MEKLPSSKRMYNERKMKQQIYCNITDHLKQEAKMCDQMTQKEDERRDDMVEVEDSDSSSQEEESIKQARLSLLEIKEKNKKKA